MAESDLRTGAAHRPSSSRMNALDWLALILLIIGGLNWGLVGAFNLDLVASLLGEGSMLARIVYLLVGLAAIWGFAIMRLGRGGRY